MEKLSKNVSFSKTIQVKNTKIVRGGPLVCFHGSGRRFCFGRGSDVSSIFWTSVFQVEQMNKKVDLMRKETTSFSLFMAYKIFITRVTYNTG